MPGKGRKTRKNFGKGSAGGAGFKTRKATKKKKVVVIATKRGRYQRAGKRTPVSRKQLVNTLGNRLTSNAEVVRTGSVARFGTGRMNGSLQMSGRQRIGQIQAVSFDSATRVAIVFDSTARSDTIMPLNPTMLVYFGTPLFNIAACFQNFLFVKFVLQYKTRSGTQDNGGLVLAYFPDVDYLEGVGYSGTTPFVAEADLVKSSSTVTIPFYRDFNYVAPVMVNRSAPRFFTRNEYSGTSNGYVLDGVNDVANDRQTFEGMVVVSGSVGGASPGFLWGDIYLDYTIELGDLTEPATTPTVPSRTDKALTRQLMRLGVPFDEKKVQPRTKLHLGKTVEEIRTSESPDFVDVSTLDVVLPTEGKKEVKSREKRGR